MFQDSKLRLRIHLDKRWHRKHHVRGRQKNTTVDDQVGSRNVAGCITREEHRRLANVVLLTKSLHRSDSFEQIEGHILRWITGCLALRSFVSPLLIVQVPNVAESFESLCALDWSWRNTVDSDTMRSPLSGQYLRDGIDTGFGSSRVNQAKCATVVQCHRNVDDNSRLLLLHSLIEDLL